MPNVKGRDLTSPVVSTGFTARGVVIRIDDNDHPAFWLAVEFSIANLRKMIDQWEAWMMNQTEEWSALPTEEQAG